MVLAQQRAYHTHRSCGLGVRKVRWCRGSGERKGQGHLSLGAFRRWRRPAQQGG